MGGVQTGQSWEWGETEHSVCCVYEGRTWRKHKPACKSILCCSLLHACLLNTVFVLPGCTVTLRINAEQHLVPPTLRVPSTQEEGRDKTAGEKLDTFVCIDFVNKRPHVAPSLKIRFQHSKEKPLLGRACTFHTSGWSLPYGQMLATIF